MNLLLYLVQENQTIKETEPQSPLKAYITTYRYTKSHKKTSGRGKQHIKRYTKVNAELRTRKKGEHIHVPRPTTNYENCFYSTPIFCIPFLSLYFFPLFSLGEGRLEIRSNFIKDMSKNLDRRIPTNSKGKIIGVRIFRNLSIEKMSRTN